MSFGLFQNIDTFVSIVSLCRSCISCDWSQVGVFVGNYCTIRLSMNRPVQIHYLGVMYCWCVLSGIHHNRLDQWRFKHLSILYRVCEPWSLGRAAVQTPWAVADLSKTKPRDRKISYLKNQSKTKRSHIWKSKTKRSHIWRTKADRCWTNWKDKNKKSEVSGKQWRRFCGGFHDSRRRRNRGHSQRTSRQCTYVTTNYHRHRFWNASVIS